MYIDFIILQRPHLEIFNIIESFLNEFKTLDANGYLNTIDLSTYPIIKTITPYFVTSKEYKNGRKSKEAFK